MNEVLYLVLENGAVFQGKSFGAKGEAVGEIVFTTGMTGYLETLTDPSYYGQILVHTFPMIGNYGIIPPDFESKIVGPAAVIVKEWCKGPSNFRSQGTLDHFMKEHKVPGLYGIDTRALTKLIREQGNMKGILTDDPTKAKTMNWESQGSKEPVPYVSTRSVYEERAGTARYRVAILDFGIKENIKRELLKRGCDLIVFPYSATKEDILSVNPDGILLSNGPGDPMDNMTVISNLKRIIETGIPILGICLGHQLLALANGFRTTKLAYGHRGANQPVRELATGKVFISSQNHGYAVEKESVDPAIAIATYDNGNDGTCEGLEYINQPIFSVQFHPEGCGGPKDTAFLFDKFIKHMEVSRNAVK